MKTITITDEVLAVLKASVITETKVVLPQSPRHAPKLYKDVNKVLELAGGTWNRGQQAHLFTTDPRERLGLALSTGTAEVDMSVAAPKLQAAAKKKEMQAFYTPASLARRVVQLADVSGKWVIEPSCGEGALIEAAFVAGAKTVIAFDVDTVAMLKIPLRTNLILKTQDFLKTPPPTSEVVKADRIVMNPPFAKGQDIKHLLHALGFLRPNGVLVAIMSATAPTKDTFVRFAAHYPYEVFQVEEGAFKESGTNVSTVIVRITNRIVGA